MSGEEKTRAQLQEEIDDLRSKLSTLRYAEEQRQHVEETLRRSEQEKELILENIFDLVVFRNKHMETVWASKPLREWLHCTRENVVGRVCYKARYGRDEPCEECWVIKTMVTGRPQKRENRSPDGRMWFVTCNPVFDETGAITGTVEISQDITERKEVEEQLNQSLERLQKLIEGTKYALTRIVDVKDPYTSGHQRRVTQLACAIGRQMQLPSNQIDGINLAGLLHDVGKIAVPGEILNKPRGLTELEFSIVKTHPQVAYDILKTIEFPWPIAEIIFQHHERLDGSGYPKGLLGDKILFEARLLAVADVVEAISSHRPYRPALGVEVALSEITQYEGSRFDPEIVEQCVRLFNDFGFTFNET